MRGAVGLVTGRRAAALVGVLLLATLAGCGRLDAGASDPRATDPASTSRAPTPAGTETGDDGTATGSGASRTTGPTDLDRLTAQANSLADQLDQDAAGDGSSGDGS